MLQLDFSTKLCFSTATTFLAVNLLDRFFSTTFMLQHQLNQQQQQQQQQRDGASNAGGREERRITRSSSSHSSYPSYPSYRGDFECVPPQHLMRLPPKCGERPQQQQQQQAAEEEEEEGGEEEEEKEEEFLPPPTDAPYDMLLLLNLATAAARVCFCTIVVTATAF
jgi:hypothetical protein